MCRRQLKAAATVGAALLLAICSTTVFAADAKLPDGPGVNLIYTNCQTCHSLQYVEEARGLLPAQWDSLIAGMQGYGLEVSDADKAKILDYLKTYLGPNPPPATTTTAAAVAAVDGGAIFKQNCAACHGAKGLGQPGYFPPLAGNGDVAASQVFPVLVVLNGMSGSITVEGQDYNGSMPALNHLSNKEIAAVVNYVRDTFNKGTQTQLVTAELVAQQRQLGLSATDVHTRRQKLLK